MDSTHTDYSSLTRRSFEEHCEHVARLRERALVLEATADALESHWEREKQQIRALFQAYGGRPAHVCPGPTVPPTKRPRSPSPTLPKKRAQSPKIGGINRNASPPPPPPPPIESVYHHPPINSTVAANSGRPWRSAGCGDTSLHMDNNPMNHVTSSSTMHNVTPPQTHRHDSSPSIPSGGGGGECPECRKLCNALSLSGDKRACLMMRCPHALFRGIASGAPPSAFREDVRAVVPPPQTPPEMWDLHFSVPPEQ